MNESSKSSENLASEVESDRREVFRVPGKLKPSEWASQHRILTGKAGAAEPGPWRADRTPYIVEVIDTCIDPVVREIVCPWATQIGKSTAIENLIGYWADEDAGNALLVMPNEESVKETLAERIKPMVLASPRLSRICREQDITANAVEFATMTLYGGWATSPASLARRSCRYALFDECDKFPVYSGKEGDPISLGEKRLQTYGHRRRSIKVSSPSNRQGHIWRAWELCGDRRFYMVPCPHCGEYQRLIWQQVKWEKLDIPDPAQRARLVQQGKLAWYECSACKKQITDWHKPKMLAQGKWISEGQSIDADGRIEGTRPKSPSVGFHLSTIYSPWVTWPELVAEFIKAEGDPSKTQDFYNSLLAEPFDNLVTKTQASVIRKKSEASSHERGTVPESATILIATADTQDKWFKVHIGAWSPGYRYQLVQEMECTSFDEVRQLCLETAYPVVNSDRVMVPAYLLIDSGGNRTEAVYEFCATNPAQIIPTKGYKDMDKPWGRMETSKPGLNGRRFSTTFFKDMLSRLIHDQDETRWMPHKNVSEQFCTEMTNEHKIILRGKGESWEKKSQGARVESWDCEVIQCLAAYVLNLGAHNVIIEHKPEPKPAVRDERHSESSFLPAFDGW